MYFDLDFEMPPLDWREGRIPKKNKPGEFRRIVIPNDELKALQKRILQFMYKIEGLRPASFAHGFVPFRNTSSGVSRHDPLADIILCMDAKDFFDTFPLEPVRERMLKAGLGDELTDRILTACSYNGTLPQGGPCSPYLTNVGMFETDLVLSAFARNNGFSYTRYADDLTMSMRLSDGQKAPEKFGRIFHGVDSLLQQRLGIRLNWKKNHVIKMSGSMPRRVLGIVIRKDGKGYNAPREMRRQARAMLCNLYWKINHAGWRVTSDDRAEWARLKGYVRYMDNLRSYGTGQAASADPVIQDGYWTRLLELMEEPR